MFFFAHFFYPKRNRNNNNNNNNDNRKNQTEWNMGWKKKKFFHVVVVVVVHTNVLNKMNFSFSFFFVVFVAHLLFRESFLFIDWQERTNDCDEFWSFFFFLDRIECVNDDDDDYNYHHHHNNGFSFEQQQPMNEWMNGLQTKPKSQVFTWSIIINYRGYIGYSIQYFFFFFWVDEWMMIMAIWISN